ncbi:MAG: type II secretion system F family protein [Actinomycetota bacterium]|nr:type II secretion system F family protein [Actinomycetota bacterium]
MAPELMKLASLALTFAGVSAVTYNVMRTRAQRATIRAGLEDALLDNRAVAASREATMRGPFSTRVIGPLGKKAARLVYRFGPKGLAEQTSRRLVLGGVSERLDVDTFFAIAVGFPLMALALLVTLSSSGRVAPLLWLIIPVTGFLPKMWLTSKVEARQRAVRLALPDTLDLLTIAIEAGLGFDSALARVTGAIPGPLSDELYRMLQELRIGVPREQALRNLAERTEVDDLDQFITAVGQADAFGISVGRVLRVQAHQLRQKRSQIAEEKAAKTPVKLLFPLLVCIFPTLFTVLVGPAAINIMKSLMSAI